MTSKSFFLAALCSIQLSLVAQPSTAHLRFTQLAKTWDEAIPLGNAMLGALVWQKAGDLRFSLDRADLWDQRPMKGLHRKEFSYQWVQEQVKNNNYKIVQEYFDEPYDREPGPTKIPGAALMFDTKSWGAVKEVKLDISGAYCTVIWESGAVLKTFVHATQPIGRFRFENLSKEIFPTLIPPEYQGQLSGAAVNSLEGDDLVRLGYPKGSLTQYKNAIQYVQEGWGGFKYEVSVRWNKKEHNALEGVWSISSYFPSKKKTIPASVYTKKAISESFVANMATHKRWWKNFWSKSSISIPDTLLEKQWYLEQYKFGSAARKGAPPISLQAVWTADNGRIPPWKGDYHHDLNTQLSYWPAYSGNHLEEAWSYLDHLDENKPNYKRYTKMYFNREGLAVPGVTTLDGTEMGGWIQYSLSPTISSWLSQHYYWQWRYSMDRDFLAKRAYPWIKEVSVFLEGITYLDEQGFRRLPISSSPEINDNSITAWFPQNTNYDLALMKYNFHIAAELASELGIKGEAKHWQEIASQFDNFSLSANSALKFAPNMPYNQSHRHFSNAMAIHPLGLIKYEDGPQAQKIINNTIQVLDSVGPAYWCGYSYAWLANIKARAKDGAGAANDLSIFAKAFCLPNSFHANGDQTKSGYSNFTYRPFTLEGNFAFASGLQEMLLQSYAGFIDIMPAIPKHWDNVSFKNLRAEGAFLVTAQKRNGKVDEVKIVAEKGGIATLKLPFANAVVGTRKGIVLSEMKAGFATLTCQTGGYIILKNPDE